MKKVALVILSVFILSAVSIAQTGKKTRPRIVRETQTVQRDYPKIQNDQNTGVQDRQKPVLNDRTNAGTRPIDAPPPLVVEPINDENDVIEIETNLVTLPVTVLDRQGRFVSGLLQRDFRVYEDGIEQQVGYFASVEKPFTVILMIDTSPSTQYKIEEIRSAAIAFVDQLRFNDRVMVVAFDQSYTVLSSPTNDRSRLRSAIRRADFGSGTSIYDAVNRTIDNEIKRIDGRKAIVMFTDGVDTTSKRANYESTVRKAEEADALIYPIRYDTSGQYSSRGSGGRRLPRRRTGSIFGDILVGIITASGGGRVGTTTGAGQSSSEYAKGKSYLEELARLSGGRIFEADTTYNLDAAFRSIAEELRRQYSLGYYPEKIGQAGDRKRIRVRVKRASVIVRTKRSYIVGN